MSKPARRPVPGSELGRFSSKVEPSLHVHCGPSRFRKKDLYTKSEELFNPGDDPFPLLIDLNFGLSRLSGQVTDPS
jgi:hypothetical protein